MMIFKKLANIDNNAHKNYFKSMKPQYKIKKNVKETFIINGIKSLAQENLFILKNIRNHANIKIIYVIILQLIFTKQKLILSP